VPLPMNVRCTFGRVDADFELRCRLRFLLAALLLAREFQRLLRQRAGLKVEPRLTSGGMLDD
jgi:hypothetical protein